MKKNITIFDRDPFLQEYKDDIKLRVEAYQRKRKEVLGDEKKLSLIANFHHYYGLHKTRTGWIYREWAPEADQVLLTGDFNNWDNQSHPLTRLDDKSWEISIKGIKKLDHNSRIKVIIRKDGVDHYRVPMFINKVKQEVYSDGRIDFYGLVNNPTKSYKFKNDFKIEKTFQPYIYESHIGIAQDKEGIGSYKEFMNILPRIKNLGYNAIQIMALASHAYYGSFGYHVTNYFAASHWFGDTEDLKRLIDKAHELGLAVFMDIVHSHASKNVYEGINYYDTTDYQLFHSGERGNHPLWDSRLFDYGKHDVIKFLLSNIKYFLEEYKLDGFRFDGVTSMIYLDHGINHSFTSYDEYFSMNADFDAISYLTLANELIKEIRPDAITIAEEVSGYPALASPITEGGIGFDYRFNMGVADYWAKELDKDDHDWSISWMWHELTSKREGEKSISYAECHDQAFVGDKTIMFKLTDAEIYWNMDKKNSSHIIHRAIALHKLITGVTMHTAADGYLNFMGNEFGHPEWIDFPSEQNGWSYKYAKRQWHLVDNPNLKYEWLNNFNKDSLAFIKENHLYHDNAKLLMLDNEFKLLVFERQGFTFIYNFHPTRSYEGLVVPLLSDGEYKVVFNSDEIAYGGLDRISTDYVYQSQEILDSDFNVTDFDHKIHIYSPSRTMMVLKRI